MWSRVEEVGVKEWLWSRVECGAVWKLRGEGGKLD